MDRLQCVIVLKSNVYILFWPTLFFLEGGDGPQAQEYARLKGERDAIGKVAVVKKCAIEFAPLSKTETAKLTS